MNRIHLDHLPGLIEALYSSTVWQDFEEGVCFNERNAFALVEDGLYCTRCGDYRRIEIRPIHIEIGTAGRPPGYVRDPSQTGPSPFPGPPTDKGSFYDVNGHAYIRMPAIFDYRCIQCDARWTALMYNAGASPGFLVLPKQETGIATPHCPTSVRYFLDQAARAHTVGANSAAVAMFRSALECLLIESGFGKGDINKQLQSLEAKITTGTAPQWASNLDHLFMDILRRLGNMAVHANSGDVSLQAHLDDELYNLVELTFVELLHRIYEEPVDRGGRLAKIKDRLNPASASPNS
jgi:hypothetical protein